MAEKHYYTKVGIKDDSEDKPMRKKRLDPYKKKKGATLGK